MLTLYHLHNYKYFNYTKIMSNKLLLSKNNIIKQYIFFKFYMNIFFFFFKRAKGA